MNGNSYQTQLLHEAAEWRLISLLFDCPKDDWFEQVEALGKQVADENLKKAADAARQEATEGLFHSVFGPGGPAPGREVSYRGWVQPGYLLSEISSFYNAFSYELKTQEVPDHITVETGFVSYLRMKELYAIQCGETESARITAEASETFINDHVSKYAEKLSKLLAVSGIEYLELVSASLLKRVGPDKDKGKNNYLPVLEETDESMFECGVGTV